MDRLLESVPFRRLDRAQRSLSGLASLNPQTREILHSLLVQSPDPDTALQYLERFLSSGAGAAEVLSRNSRSNALIAIFSYSHFLSEAVIQHPDWIDWAL